MASVDDFLALSDAVYAGPGSSAAPPGWTKIDESPSAPGHAGSSNGYFGAAYQNDATGEIVIANRGSRPTAEGLRQDWGGSDVTILGQGVRGVPAAFGEATAFAAQVRAKNPGQTLSFTGHSLGGAEAQVQAAATGGGGVTFGAPGAAFAVAPQAAAAVKDKVTNFALPGDLIGGYGSPIGQRVFLAPARGTLAKDIGALGAGLAIGGPLGILVAAVGLIASNHPLGNYRLALAGKLPPGQAGAAVTAAGGGPLQVINAQNMIACTGCPKPQPLIVTQQQNVFCEEELCAVITDRAPMVNILPFGPCAFTPAPPSPSGGPCIPKTAPTWTPGSAFTKYDHIPALRQTDTLMCMQGGVISVMYACQEIFMVE